MRFLAVAVCVLLIPSTLALDETDLENGNCGAAGLCPSVESSLALSDIWMNRSCLCDLDCKRYGDCCADSKNYDELEQKRAISSFSCLVTGGVLGVYVKVSCPTNWTNANVRKLCERSKAGNDKQDPLLQIPVTSLRQNMTYGNVYCAVCNEDHKEIEYWRMTLSCPTDDNSVLAGSDSIQYSVSAGSWQIRKEDGSVHICRVNVTVPTKLSVRPCLPNMVQSCDSNWTNSDIRNRCEANTLVVRNSDKWYRNSYCATCNNESEDRITCVNHNKRALLGAKPFSVLFSYRDKSREPKNPFSCESNYTRDFAKIPEHVRQIRCVYHDDPGLVACPKYILTNLSEYKENNNRGLILEYQLTVDGNCSPNNCEKSVSNYYLYSGVLTAVGIGISILCLTVHLLAFCLVKQLRNLAGMNLASFCFALLIAYCSFILSDYLKCGTRACFLDSVVTYYFFLAAFFWTTTSAFDVWRVVHGAIKHLHTSEGIRWKRFIIYSCWSWMMPAGLVLTALLVENEIYISNNFRPHFGTESCWFGNGKALFVFFALPLSVLMVSNATLFVSSWFMIYSSQSTIKQSASWNTVKNLKLFSRLALITGFTWITGLVGGAMENELVWVIFILLNTLQGLFVFIGFTCQTRVLNGIREIGLCRMPNFSSASASTSEVAQLAGMRSHSTIDTTSITLT